MRVLTPRTGGLLAGVLALALGARAGAAQAAPAGGEAGTRFVLLGTGTPNADPERSGPASAVVVNGRAYLVDAGPGVVRRAAKAARELGIEALAPGGLGAVFLTHLHSDHTVGLPDLLYTPWVLDRPGRLRVFGPPGTREMMEHIGRAWSEDVRMRVYGLEPREANWEGYDPVVEEIGPGWTYEDADVRIQAIPVTHGSWPVALGFRFETSDRVIVVSGDARPGESLVEACDGCDVLVHEVYSAERFADRPEVWRTYHASFHTSTRELAGIAAKARPKLLVLYHQLYWGATDDDLIREIREAGYDGPVVSGRDLGVY